MLDLTIAIPVRNEERNLPSCLQAIGQNFARRVVVIDSLSNDDTAKHAREHGADFLTFQWNGMYPKKRNWFLHYHKPDTEWIMFLDADEWLTHQVKLEISKKLDDSRFNGYWLSYSIYFLGQLLRGGYPLRKLALFRVNSGEYERIDEKAWSDCDMEVHEHPIISGPVGYVSSRIDHYDLRGVDSYVRKHIEYASWEANRMISSRSNRDLKSKWTLSQHMKYRLVSSPWGGLFFFIGSFFLMGGWRDGTVGFAFAVLKSAYFVQVGCRVVELERIKLNALPAPTKLQ